MFLRPESTASEVQQWLLQEHLARLCHLFAGLDGDRMLGISLAHRGQGVGVVMFPCSLSLLSSHMYAFAQKHVHTLVHRALNGEGGSLLAETNISGLSREEIFYHIPDSGSANRLWSSLMDARSSLHTEVSIVV